MKTNKIAKNVNKNNISTNASQNSQIPSTAPAHPTPNIKKTAGTVSSAVKETLVDPRTELLLQKIGKKGDLPSKTGLSLDDAIKIDNFVNKHLPLFKERFNHDEFKEKIKVIPRGEEGLPCKIVFGVKYHPNNQDIIKDADGSPCFVAAVLYKGKVTASEFNPATMKALNPDQRVTANNPDPNRRIKIGPIANSSEKIIKGAQDWITGDPLVEVIFKHSKDTGRDPAIPFYREFFFMKQLYGKPGIVEAGFMSRVYRKTDRTSRMEYLMPRYEELFEITNQILTKKESPYTNEQLLTFFEDLINGLNSLWEAKLIHRDHKLENLLRKNNKHVLCDFGLGETIQEHEKNFKNPSPNLCGTLFNVPPEIVNQHRTSPEIFNDARDYPYATDMWGAGIEMCTMITAGYPCYNLVRKFMEDTQAIAEYQTSECLTYESMDNKIDNLFNQLKIELTNGYIPILNLVREMLRADPKKRIAVVELRIKFDLLKKGP